MICNCKMKFTVWFSDIHLNAINFFFFFLENFEVCQSSKQFTTIIFHIQSILHFVSILKRYMLDILLDFPCKRTWSTNTESKFHSKNSLMLMNNKAKQTKMTALWRFMISLTIIFELMGKLKSKHIQ